MSKRRTIALTLAVICVLAGVGLMSYPFISDAWYAYAQARLEADAAIAAAGSVGQPGGGVALPSGVVAKIAVPEIGLKAYVLEGTSRSVLAKAPGHYEETPLPGEAGNSAIAAHRTMHGHAFNRLDELEAGDAIVVWTETGKHVFRVTGVTVVRPTDVSVVAQTPDPRLTLTTCHPEGSARQRLVVSAALAR